MTLAVKHFCFHKLKQNCKKTTLQPQHGDISHTIMTTRSLQTLQFPDDDGEHVFLEYIALDHTLINITTKTYIVNYEPKSPKECPVRSFNQFDTFKMEYPCPELALQPVAIYRDPFRKGRNKIVLCELRYFDGKPVEINRRHECCEFMTKVQGEDPWVGFEQEFIFVDDDGEPCDWHLQVKDPDLDTGCELFYGKHVALQREIVEMHLKACIYAGLSVYGMNREATPSQWEYQTGPLPVIEACDQLHVSRYILRRLVEMYGQTITFFQPPCFRDNYCRMALHVNFSTAKMRGEGGIKYIRDAMETVAKHEQEGILKYYDLVPGNDYKWRLSGMKYMPKHDEFIIKVGDKSDSSLRIPMQVDKDGCGYFEERRPSSEADPYDITRVLTAAALIETNKLR